MKTGKTILIFFIVIATAIGSIFGKLIIKSFFENEISIHDQLMYAANEINTICPIMADRETRLDNAVALPNSIFQYNYTFVNLSKAFIDVKNVKSKMSFNLLNSIKTNPEMKFFRDNNVILVYSYNDKNGRFVFSFEFDPKDYNDNENQVTENNKTFVEENRKQNASQSIEQTKEVLKRKAEAKFNKYLPTILESRDAYLDGQDTYIGDFTGDAVDDVAIKFVLIPNGGNAICHQMALYSNNGTEVSVMAGFEPSYWFDVIKVGNGSIVIEKHEHGPNDGRCCPSIHTRHTLTISGSQVY